MDAVQVVLPELPADRYRAWAERLLDVDAPPDLPAAATLLEVVEARARDVDPPSTPIAPAATLRSPAGAVVASLQRLTVLASEEPGGLSPDVEETGWLIELSLRRAARHLASPALPMRLIVADDDPRMLGMLTVAFDQEPDIDVVGLASDVSEAIAMARTTRPHVALVDVRMPRGGGPRAARGILALSPATRVVAHSALDDREAVVSMLEAGAVGYLVKGGPHEELAAAIRRTARGDRPLSDEVTGQVLEELTHRVRLEADGRGTRDHLDRQVRRFLVGRGVSLAWAPIVRLRTSDIVGAEALPRFDHPARRSADAWFREAWSLGLGYDLEVTVLRAAAERLARLPDDLLVAVNLSPASLVDDRLASDTEDLPWRRILLEVTERAEVEDYGRLREAVAEIRGRGARLAVDDAGAALASLRHVAEIEPDLVKLDALVARNVHIDPRMHALASALISFARELGADVVADGIDHRGQADALQALGVEYGQGGFLGGVPHIDEVDVRLLKELDGR